MLIIYSLQVLVPLALILNLAIWRPRTVLGFCCELAAIFTLLLTLLFTGLWLVPAWWTPYVFAVLTVVAALLHLRRKPRFETAMPSGAKQWARPVIFLALTAICLTQLFPALEGQSAPQGAIAIDYPLGPGSYLIVSGGNDSTINSHFLTLNEEEPRFQQWRGQSYALDIVKLNDWGFRGLGILPEDPSSYFIYGANVVSPCEGVVTRMVDGVPDNSVPQTNRDSMSGNHVLISCKGVEVLLAHMIPNSIRVSEESPVRVGEILGLAGNSGNSGEPHLHIHVQALGAPGETLDTDPLPFTIAGKYWTRNQRMVVP